MSVEIFTPPKVNDESYQFGINVLTGLLEPKKNIASKYFYDETSCALYNKITRLPEYYLTNCENEILKTHKNDIITLYGNQPFNLIELGPGEGNKTEIIIEALLDNKTTFNYIPIDISKNYIHYLSEKFKQKYPGLSISGIISDYFLGLRWLHTESTLPNVVLFLGSSIGNFTFAKARVFFHSLWNALKPNDIVLIGFDLRKDIEVLKKAYDDSQGITRQFNLNLLKRINRELGGNFDINKYRHFASYNVFSGAMESYLVSQEKQTVYINNIRHTFHFEPWEPIHVEYSYKYLLSDIQQLAEDTGFQILENFTDQKHYFIDSIWQVSKARQANQ